MPKKQVQVSLTYEEIEIIDRMAEQQERSRSYILAEFIRRAINWREVRHVGRVVAYIDVDYVTGIDLVGSYLRDPYGDGPE